MRRCRKNPQAAEAFVPIAMTKSDVITFIIAAYGAVLSTIAIAKQFVSDRIKVKLTVRRNMNIVGDPRYHGKTLTILKVINVGHRPVTITTGGAMSLHPSTTHWVFSESKPRFPCEITEGKYITCIADQGDIDFSTVDYWTAVDSRGTTHTLQEASRIRHWKSAIRRKFLSTKTL